MVEQIVITEREEREKQKSNDYDTIFVGMCSGHYQQ